MERTPTLALTLVCRYLPPAIVWNRVRHVSRAWRAVAESWDVFLYLSRIDPHQARLRQRRFMLYRPPEPLHELSREELVGKVERSISAHRGTVVASLWREKMVEVVDLRAHGRVIGVQEVLSRSQVTIAPLFGVAHLIWLEPGVINARPIDGWPTCCFMDGVEMSEVQAEGTDEGLHIHLSRGGKSPRSSTYLFREREFTSLGCSSWRPIAWSARAAVYHLNGRYAHVAQIGPDLSKTIHSERPLLKRVNSRRRLAGGDSRALPSLEADDIGAIEVDPGTWVKVTRVGDLWGNAKLFEDGRGRPYIFEIDSEVIRGIRIGRTRVSRRGSGPRSPRWKISRLNGILG